MKNSKSNKLYLLILLILIFLVSLFFYKVNFYDKKDRKYVYNLRLIEENKPNIKNGTDNLLINYDSNIIKENQLSFDYEYFDKENSILGKIYIDENKLLHITETNTKLNYIVSKIKFKTLYKSSYSYNDIFIYLISEDSKLYYFSLNDNDVKNAVVKEINLPTKVKNFTNLNYKKDMFGNSASLFILDESNEIYDITSNINYDNNIISLYNKYYVFDNKIISNIYGNILEKNNNPYKVKNFFVIKITDKKTRGIIITENDELIYIDDTNQILYEFEEKVKSIDYSENNPYIYSNLKIVFEDGYEMIYSAMCSSFYCINS